MTIADAPRPRPPPPTVVSRLPGGRRLAVAAGGLAGWRAGGLAVGRDNVVDEPFVES